MNAIEKLLLHILLSDAGPLAEQVIHQLYTRLKAHVSATETNVDDEILAAIVDAFSTLNDTSTGGGTSQPSN